MPYKSTTTISTHSNFIKKSGDLEKDWYSRQSIILPTTERGRGRTTVTNIGKGKQALLTLLIEVITVKYEHSFLLFVEAISYSMHRWRTNMPEVPF